MSGITPSQTIGPFFSFGLTPRDYDWNEAIGSNLLTPDATGERIRIVGKVLDGDGVAVVDSMLEIWQADAAGRYAHPADGRASPNAAFKGFGRAGTDKDGAFSFDTVKPGAVPGPGGTMQAPHVAVVLFSRGMLTHVFTRIYFDDEAANATDPILALVPEDRRRTLIARREDAGAHPTYRLDIRLQGDGETVFFDI